MTTRSAIPFNIELLQLQPSDTSRLRQVRSLDIFEGATHNFNSEGLFSTETFGIVGSDARMTRFAYIDLKISIIHPTVYNALMNMRSFYRDILASKEFAKWDPELKDFVKSDVIDGQTGFEYFIEHLPKIQFEARPSVRREQAIRLIDKYRERMLLDKILVLPAGLRDVEVDASGRATSDEINEMYHRMLAIANTINPSTAKISPEAYNTQRVSLQNTFNEIYEYLSKIIEGKKNLMMGKWASRKTNDGTRNVITAMDTKVTTLGGEGNVGFNDTMVGIYQATRAIRPVALFQMRNGFLASCFSVPGAPVRLTNRKTLRSEYVDLKRESYDRWLSNEGLEKFMAAFKENSIRHNAITIEDYYLGLTYRGPDGTFRLIHGIDELPEGRDAKDCTPITIAEFFYTQIYHVANKYTGFVTRYPVTGVGSVYPSKLYLMSTVKSERRVPLNDQWEPMPGLTAYQFPIVGSEFYGSLSPHPSRLAGLGGDFDGDTCSFTVAYTDEAIQETDAFLNSKKGYVGSNGKFTADCNTDTIKYVLHNLTGIED